MMNSQPVIKNITILALVFSFCVLEAVLSWRSLGRTGPTARDFVLILGLLFGGSIFRYYNPRWGRFMSADPLSGNLGNPQSLNKLAYVGNNPLNAVDPFGLETCAQNAQPGGCVDVVANAPSPLGSNATWFWLFAAYAPGFGDFMRMIMGIPPSSSSVSSAPADPPPSDEDPGPPVLRKKQSPPDSATCQLVAPGGDYNLGTNAVALFQPPMANALTDAFNSLNSQGITPTINSGYRSPLDQTRMQNGGSGPNPAARISWHQVGMAVDINGTSSSDFPTIISAMQAQGLTWGGTFTHRDLPHFQLPRAGTSPTAAMVSACGGGH